MPRSRSVSSSLRNFGGVHWIDWLVSILLIAAIIIVAVCVCNNPNRDSADNKGAEGFFSSCSFHKDSDDEESFTNASAGAPKVVTNVADLDNLGANDIGCCLVHYEKCGHCKQYKPVWKNICSQVNGKTYGGKRIQMFECGDTQHQGAWQDVSSRFGIRGYPTILVKIGGENADWVEYTGSRNALGEYLKKSQ